MKNLALFLFSGSLLIVSGLNAQIRETPATLGLIAGGNPRGYVQGSNDQGILFATSSGSSGNLVPYSTIRGEGLDKLIRYDARNEALAEPRAMFDAGRFEEAAEAFEQVARNYVIIVSAPQNFALEAFFYQLESLLRAGEYEELAKLIDAPVAATIGTKMGPYYQKSFEYQKLWALFGKKDIEGIRAALATYEQPVSGDAELLSTPNFINLPGAELAQLAFLRAGVYSADGETDKAHDDYYRAFTLAFGNKPMLAEMAMTAVLEIQKNDPGIASDNRQAVAELQSVAYLFGKRFGNEKLPADVAEFAVRPTVARPVRVQEAAPAEEAKEEEPAPAPEEEPAEPKKKKKKAAK
tara:strand:+ start:7044 stop:8099 length:1056 start_codon:yes stop_codon:yes gene_type:complete